MEDFLKKFSTIPKNFIKDFFIIAKEEYSDNELIIDFDIVCKWLNVRKDNLKTILVNNFEEDFDYIIEIKKKKQTNSTGKTTYHEILITPNCMKELCMISQTKKAKEVRKYFIALEKLIKKYFEDIKNQMYNKIGILEQNQKPKIDIKKGVIYILEAQNTDTTLYKLGKSDDIKKRLKTYNTGNANDVEPLFIVKVSDITSAENCIKSLCKKYQYRKYKEIYEIDLELFKKVLETCSDISNELTKEYNNNKIKKEFINKISRMKNPTSNNKYFMYLSKN